MFSDEILQSAERVLAQCRRAGLKIATAESCTGGLIAASLTAIAGSSDVVDRGFVTYTNEAKQQMLGVPAPLFGTVGAVSEEVARAMAEGAIRNSDSDLSVSVTGVAGPGGGSADKPVGLVHMAVARKGKPTRHQRHLFTGDRTAVRTATVVAGLSLINKMLDD
ncbi:MAG: CinA family protein [Rhodospirillales bacterium]|nr:CinA family protein [Rhodospirillales bacterium]